MNFNEQENLINNNEELKEMKELVELRNSNDEDEMSNKEKEKIPEIPEEEKQNIEKKEILEKPKEEEENISNEEEKNNKDEVSVPIGKKEIEGLLLILNSYWVEFIGSISLIISLLIVSFIILLFVAVIDPFKQKKSDDPDIIDIIIIIFEEIGFKWFFFITMGNHLSVGLFSLAIFTSILKDTKNLIKFYIVNFIKAAIYYALSIIFIKLVLNDLIKNSITDKIRNADVTNDKVYIFFDILVEKSVDYFGGFLSTYNIFLEKIVFGTMYIFLFNTPKCLEGKKIIYFRLLALIPVLYTITSLVLRALNYSYKDEKRILEINLYVLPLLLGSKITIYMFFISTLSIIKLLSLKNEVFDEENEIKPKVFNKIGSRCFAAFGILELIIGLFLPSWSAYGIGGKYLLILSAPIMALYDYKKKYKLKFPCCKKGDMASCFKKVFLSIAFLIIIFFIFLLLISTIMLFLNKPEIISNFLINNYGLAIYIRDLIL